MSNSSEYVSSTTMSTSNSKITALESTLHQSITYCRDLVKQFEELNIESEEYKKKFITQKEKCESKNCSSSEELKKDIESKNNIIQSVALTLTKLYETKNFNILNDVFKVLCGDKLVDLPKFDQIDIKNYDSKIKQEVCTPKKEILTPKKVFISTPDLLIKDESVSEIEGTPTGRTSPIIQSRKLRSYSNNNSIDLKDKKKCPENWPTPESKAIKLSYPSPTSTRGKGGGRLRQSRLNLIKLKTSNVVDLTNSPELMTGAKSSQNVGNVQPLVKKESTDNDDTILPSPTSGPNNFISLYKTTSINSPNKFKKPPLCLKSKAEVETPIKLCDIENTPIREVRNGADHTEDSINLLKPIRFMQMLNEHSPIKIDPVDDDETHCEIASSLSILDHVDILELNDKNDQQKQTSPNKKPLEENKNITNIPAEDTDSSISLLRRVKVSPTEEKAKRTILSCKRPPAPVEPLYKEQIPRTKAEKRKLRGWNCDECKNFYDELYQDDPEMLAKKMDECSKHRGKNNPARPKTPEGFWNPRWSVPHDTEEFNKRNNAE